MVRENKSAAPKIVSTDFVLLTTINMLVGTVSVMSMTTLLMYGLGIGLSNSTAGLLTAVFAIFSTIGRPFSGILADKMSKKKLLWASLIIFAAAPITFLFTDILALSMVSRAVQGFAMSIAGTVCAAMSAEIIPKERFTEGIGYFGIGISISTAVAPAVGIWLINAFGYDGMFAGMILMGAIGVALTLMLKNIGTVNVPSKKREKMKSLVQMIEKKAVFPSILQMFVSGVQICVVQLLPLFALSRGQANISIFYILSAAGVLLPKIFGKVMYRRLGNRGMGLLGYILLGGSFVGIQVLPLSGVSLLFLAVFYGAGQSVIQMALQSEAIATVEPSRHGMANATFYFATDISYAVGPLIWGGLGDAFGVGILFWIAAAVTGIGAVAFSARYYIKIQ